MSSRRAKSKRGGHPARVAAKQPQSAPKKGRPAPAAPKKARPAPAAPKKSRPAAGTALKTPRRRRQPGRARRNGAGAQAWVGRRITSLLSGRPKVERAPLTPLLELTRVDVIWAIGTAVASVFLFATVLTSFPGLGDAAESVAGVSSLGILHAPGYPAYVLVAHVFTWLIPFGGEAFKVNLFSLVCASISVAVVHLLARRCGAARWAASIGALALAATAGFWFYSGFAKHDLFSGLLFLLGLYTALSWYNAPSRRRLVTLAVLIGVGLGSSWPLEVLLFPTVLFILIMRRRRLELWPFIQATAAGLLVVIAIYGFVLVRAGQNPAVNWGRATTVSRLIDLINRADFTPHHNPPHPSGGGASAGTPSASVGQAPTGTPSASTSQTPTGAGSQIPSGTILLPAAAQLSGRTVQGVISYLIIFAMELGIAGTLLALGGFVMSLRRRRTIASHPLLIAFLSNLLGAAVVVGTGSNHSYNATISEFGFLLGSFFVLACWVAFGATALATTVTASARARALTERVRPAARSWLAPAAAVILGAAVLIPSIAGHWHISSRETKPFADAYAKSTFAELPPHAALFITGAELTDPLVYRQVVHHERRDVIPIAVDGLRIPWYREQVTRALGRPLPPIAGNTLPVTAADVIKSVAATRPTYMDPQTVAYLDGHLGYRPVGLYNVPGPGNSYNPPADVGGVEQRVLTAEKAAQMPGPYWNVWPNDFVKRSTYANAELEVARAYYLRHDLTSMKRSLENVLSIEPTNPSALKDLSLLNGTG